MKYLILASFVLLFSACDNECPACFTPPGEFRIAYEDVEGRDLLADSTIVLTSVKRCAGASVDFEVHNFIDQNLDTVSFVEISPEVAWAEGESDDGLCLHFEFEDASVDTVFYQIESYNPSKCCVAFRAVKVLYNDTNLLGTRDDYYGVYHIVK